MFWLAGLLLLSGAPLDDPAVTGYVERIVHHLTPQISVAVTVDTVARAAAFSKVGIRISTAMIAGAGSEAELAGILAHEVAHLRKGSDQAPPEDAESGLCLRFAERVDVDNAREWERSADQAAIAMLTKAGYDPAAMLRYFSLLRHASPDLPRSFSAEDILIERLQLEATDHPMKDPVEDTPEFRAVRERLK
jgi:predicted Zn-dependent protease